jgi:hypothetical protein
MRRFRAILDRVEGETAILEIAREEAQVPADWLPREASEGDVLSVEIRCVEGESRIRIRRDLEATQRARKEAKRLLQRLKTP